MLCLAACKVFNLHYGYNLYSAVINEIFLRILMVIWIFSINKWRAEIKSIFPEAAVIESTVSGH